MITKIKSIRLENFKGCRQAEYSFGDITKVFGANATGKTTIFDAFTWLLFNKDSLGSEKFDIRPLDSNGKQIDNLVINVVAVLEVDGREIEFSKTQKQKWVKKRGSATETFQGNENLYEIDGYPKTEKDYKEQIAGIIGEELFKMVTSPTYFTSLKWKEQREVLMRFVTEISDLELASGNAEFTELISELQKAPTTDDIHKKYLKGLSEWKKKQAELPIRIDEAEKQKVVIDVAELELGKKAVQEQIEENRRKQEDITKQFEEQQKLSDGIMELQFSQSDLVRKANEENNSKRRSVSEQISDKTRLVVRIESTIKETEMEISDIKHILESKNGLIKEARNRYTTTQSLEFDENSLVCGFCGQEYPVEKKEQIRADFESKKQSELASITKMGNDAKKAIDTNKQLFRGKQEELEEHKKSLEMLNDSLNTLKAEMEALPQSIDVSETDEYKTLQTQIEEKLQAVRQGNSADEIRRSLKTEEVELQAKLTVIERQIAKADINVKLDERIAELQQEQREVAQKVADQEKMLYLLEQFIRYKMDKISETINSKFDGICFKLFENQINGGLKECCECTVNGVPYSSLNSGHRIVAGLGIVKALQKLYGISAPIFVDNAESVNEFNLPQMDCQLVLLNVSNDKKLKVVV